MMLKYDPRIYGCLSPDGYDAGHAIATRRLGRSLGRPSYRFHDGHPAHVLSLAVTQTDEQHRAFLAFWTAISRGADWFLIDLRLSGVFEEMEAHATDVFSATSLAAGMWDLALPIEARRPSP